jgi:Patatin-like phospholipase
VIEGPGSGLPRVPSVPELIRARAAGTNDDYTLGLTVEGGGMRGVVSGAMLIALRDLGFVHVFDRFYGTSSGSMNLAYFAAGHGWDALSVYYDYLVSGFVRRLQLPHRPRLDMRYVFDEVMRNCIPLDSKKVASAPFDIRIVLSDVEDMRPVIVPVRSVPDRLPDYLMAGAWLPILAGPPPVLDGRRYLDGGLLWADPLYAALDEKCTRNWSGHLVPSQATSARSVCGRRSLAIFIDWRELEDGVAVGLGDEILHRRVLGRQEIPPGGCGDADVSLEDGAGLFGCNLSDGVFTGVTPAGQGHPPGRAGVVHPGHGAVGGDQPASPVVFDWDYGVGARLAGLAALGGQQV